MLGWRPTATRTCVAALRSRSGPHAKLTTTGSSFSPRSSPKQLEPSSKRTPSASSAARTSPAASGSSRGRRRSPISNRVTWLPRRRKICANSRPIAPPPTIARWGGSASSESSVSLVRKATPESRAQSGTTGRQPTLRKIFGALRTRSPTTSVSGAEKRAWPRTSSRPSVCVSHFSRPFDDWPTTPRMRSMTRSKSMETSPPMSTPKSAARRASAATRALATSVFVGVHPVLTQVPPRRSRSMRAVRWPACASRTASAGPAWPAPTTSASQCSGVMCSPFFRHGWSWRVRRV